MKIHTNAAVVLAVIALAGCSTGKKDKMVAPEPAPAAVTEPAPAADANPAATKCLENGGSIVQWATDGDPVDACRTSEGNEYSLDTASFFEG